MDNLNLVDNNAPPSSELGFGKVMLYGKNRFAHDFVAPQSHARQKKLNLA